MKAYTDTELLDYLQNLTYKNNYTGKVILRDSCTLRGWRLYETSAVGAVTNVRQAIINCIERSMA